MPRHPDLSSRLLLQRVGSHDADRMDHRQRPAESVLPRSERKLVTVLFSDLSGYTSLCERLDPEDVREMMNRVFREIVGIIVRYEGYIDRIIGDEVLAVFGLPRTHEDDPVRAIRAAWEIHAAVADMSQFLGNDLERPLSMHSGIAAGLVVTGEIDTTTGRHGITGETVNRAAMLTTLAASGEILVDLSTMRSTSGFFRFERCLNQTAHATDEPVVAYRVVDVAVRPDKIRRVLGLRARLIGRAAEMRDLHDALAAVTHGRGGCLFLVGEAGIGKSRLIAEFKQAVAQQDVGWLEGNAFIYTQGIPYYPLIDLLGRAVDIRQQDSASIVRRKLMDTIGPLEDEDGTIVHILDRLFFPETGNAFRMTPEAWRVKLHHALVKLIRKQSQRGSTVICIEDLHWADPSTVDLFLALLNDADLPVLFLVSYRPGQLDIAPDQVENRFFTVRTVNLEPLPPPESESMVRSLLQSEVVPAPLRDFIADHLGGNPFFIEELVNSLIESGTLKKSAHQWTIDGSIGEAAFASNIASVVAARLDLLGDSTKRIVQEASVIGRHFSARILKQVSAHPDVVDLSMVILKSLGMILESDAPDDPSYRFNHSLVQEVAYNSLLKRQRKDLHEKVATVLENDGADRTDTRCETLAYHFSNGHSLHKAIRYLRRSGHKGMQRFAVVESHDYYQQAYRLLIEEVGSTDGESGPMLELLLEWFFVFNVRGRFGEALDLLARHESEARNHSDPHLKGMYLARLGWTYQRREQLDRSRECLLEALAIGEQTHNYKVMAYANASLIWTCTDLGQLDDALVFASQAEGASRMGESEDASWSLTADQNLVRFVLTGTAIAHWFKGDCHACRRVGDRLLTVGTKAGDVNSISEGHLAHGMGRFAAGDYQAAIAHCMAALDRSMDPLYAINARFLMAYAHLSLGAIDKADDHLGQIRRFCATSGYEYIGTSADALAGIVAVAKGDIGGGIKAIVKQAERCTAKGKRYHAQTFQYLLGTIYLKLFLREGKMGLATAVRNAPFLIRHLPLAAGRAESHLRQAIQIAGEIGAMGIKAQASLDLARLCQRRRKKDQARQLVRESVALFDQLGADHHLARAQALLRSMSASDADAPRTPSS